MENFVVTTKYILPEMLQSTVQLQRLAPGKRDYTSVKLKKSGCCFLSEAAQWICGRVCAARSLYFTLALRFTAIHCVMFSFWRVLEAFGKLKQMGNREGTFCGAGFPSAVPPTAVATVSPGTIRASCPLSGALLWLLSATASS